MSAANSVKLTGRLARPVTVKLNKDNSRTVLATIAVERDFPNTVNGKKEYLTDFINVSHRLNPKQNADGTFAQDGDSWGKMTTKAIFSVEGEMRSFQTQAGDYGQGIELQGYPQVHHWGARGDAAAAPAVPAEVIDRATQPAPATAATAGFVEEQPFG